MGLALLLLALSLSPRLAGADDAAVYWNDLGMHPVGQVWVEQHPDAVEQGDLNRCQACHGADYRGTAISRTRADRVLHTEFGTKHFWPGFQVGCYTCHVGPGGDDANPNHPPLVSDAAAATAADVPVMIRLSASDADGNPLILRVVAQPIHGSVELSGTVATYVADAGFFGSDIFTFAAWDGSSDSNLASVAIDVVNGSSGSAPTCPGDCGNDGAVTVDELIRCVSIALGAPLGDCPPCDVSDDGSVTVDELVQAVTASLNGCSGPPTPTGATTATPTPTPTPRSSGAPTTTPTIASATLTDVQAIFTSSCTDQSCHTAADQAGDLALEPGSSHAALVGVLSANPAALSAGLLRVSPGNPDTSFLMTKLTTPLHGQGSKMPLGKPPLTAAQIQVIRDWITHGALP
jgi:hypothetical protein